MTINTSQIGSNKTPEETNQIQDLFSRATSLHTQGQLNEASKLYQALLKIDPHHADALHLNGLILANSGQVEHGIESITTAIGYNSHFAPYYINRGLLYKRQNKLNHAKQDFERAIQIEPRNFLSYQHLADFYFSQQFVDQAIHYYKHALTIEPASYYCWHQLGDSAIQQKQYDSAIEFYTKALQIDSNQPTTLVNIAVAYLHKNAPDVALPYLTKAHDLNNSMIAVYINLALAYRALHQYSSAEQMLSRAIELEPNNYELYCSFAECYKEQGQYSLALQAFKKAQQLNPNHSRVQFGLGILYMLVGDYPQGWKYYQARITMDNAQVANYCLSQPLWQGEELTGKTLFIQAEQGLGDAIQFVRYLPLIQKQFGGQLVCECQPQLIELFRQQTELQASSIKFIVRGSLRPAFDYYTHLMTLPKYYGTTIENIPAYDHYLSAPTKHRLATLIPRNEKLKIGLVWSGNPNNPNDKNRSIDLRLFIPLLQLENTQFYSLQLGQTAHSIYDFHLNQTLLDLSPYLQDFTDTAVVINQLDLIISVDTAVVHLAAALGKQTWLLIPFVPDFRWLIDREDSPWYPSIKLFRQPTRGDWESPIKQLESTLLNI